MAVKEKARKKVKKKAVKATKKKCNCLHLRVLHPSDMENPPEGTRWAEECKDCGRVRVVKEKKVEPEERPEKKVKGEDFEEEGEE